MDSLLVGIDVGCRCHRVAIGTPDGVLVDQFDVEHRSDSFANFFSRVEEDEWQEAKGILREKGLI
ncbi:MAG: hypothetical protein U9O65_03060 [Thermotogota bacterium]|nr:hypothetical protein [Thermotogota bacterium]